jgi:outer membrane protein OmpA-like peptidoglycan-associated protein
MSRHTKTRTISCGVVRAMSAVGACALLLGGCGNAQNAAGHAAGAVHNAAGPGTGLLTAQLQTILRASPVTFPSGSAEISATDTTTLTKIATVVKTSGAAITVTTHAGYPDSAQAQQLSQQRADNITKTLVAAGLAPAKITSKPAGNTTDQGEQALQTQISTP